MKNLKNIQKHGLAVFAVVLALGYGSYSYAKAAKEISTPWYEVQTPGATPGQDILGAITTDETDGGTCNETLNTNHCAVQFFNMFDTNLSGKTVAQAEALLGVNEINRTYKP